MGRDITIIKFYRKLLVIILSFGMFSCTTTEGMQANQVHSETNHIKDLFEDKPSSQSMMNSQTYAEALASASEAQQRGDLDKALFYYIQSLQFEPENAAVYFKIAQIQEQRGNNSIAAHAYSEAVKYDPTLILAYQGLGVVNMEMRKYKLAQEHLQQAISLDQTRLAQKNAEKDGEHYKLDKDSPIKSYNVLGILEDMYGNFELARNYYNLVIEVNENSANVLSNIGYSYYLTGELIAAEHYFKQAISVDSQFKRAWTNLGLVYVRKGQYSRAVKTLKQVMKEFEAYNDLGYFLMLDGRLEEAEYFFQKAIDMSPSYFEKAYSNLEQVQIKKRELWLLQNEAQGEEVGASEWKAAEGSVWSGISAEMALKNG